ncbi:MAG: cysteine desulfurase [Opitutaceae bacterium]|nr:cysteine desulfurase [Opitutaceae bacterium]
MPYFDHNATTPLLPAAREAWLRASDEAWANPSSPYRLSARVFRLLGEARARVSAHLGVTPEEIVFTSGATEANNAAIRWIARVLPADARACVAATEHPSVLAAARDAFGERCVAGPVASDGQFASATVTTTPARFVAVMAANNETGVLGPVAEVDAVCRERGAWYLCDASQWIGRLPARGLALGGFVVGCAHKFGGPKGVGFLRVPPAALAAGFRAQRGGEQEGGRRAGTENFPAIAAMVAALDAAEAQSGSIATRAAWRSAFIDAIARCIPGVVVNSGDAPCLWNTVSLRLPAHDNTRWVVRLDKLGFEVSTGSACASGSAAPSHVLAAMGLTPEAARRTIRISSGWATTERDWQLLAEALANVWGQFEAESGSGKVIQV